MTEKREARLPPCPRVCATRRWDRTPVAPSGIRLDRLVFRAEAHAYHADYIAKTPGLYLPETLGKLKLAQHASVQHERVVHDLGAVRNVARRPALP